MDNSEDRIQLLRELQNLDEDKDLATLQLPPATFNIFEATGDVRHELNHSHLLYFLLNPQSSHGLQDEFIKILLQRVFPLEDFTPTFSSPSGWSAHREYHLTDDNKGEQGRIDILLLHEEQELAVIIENKIDSDEHSNQLEFYHEMLQGRDWKIRGVFLTTDGRIPSCKKYVPISYGVVCSVISEILIDRTVADDVRTLMTHYVDMVRRNIVDELDIDTVCQRIYGKHREAFELVQGRIFTQQKKLIVPLARRVRQLVGRENARNCIHEWKNPDNYDATTVRFILPEWKNRALHTEKWPPILKCILEFIVATSPQEVYITLKIGPADPDKDSIRRSLFKMARGKDIFTVEAAPQEYSPIYRRSLLSTDKFEKLSADALVQEAGQQWDDFVKQDLPRIEDAIQQWIKEAGSTRRTYSSEEL